MATLTPELEQQLLDQIRSLPSEDVAAIARLVASLAAAPAHNPPADQEEETEEQEEEAAWREGAWRLSQPAFERAWEEGQESGPTRRYPI